MFQLEVVRDAFERKFRNLDGQLYFTLKGADWMLPVSEDEYYNARDLSALLGKIALVLTWTVTLGIAGYTYYKVIFLDAPIRYELLMFLGAFILCFVINLYAHAIPTMGMWQRLQEVQQLDDETKSKLLLRRTELI